MQRSVYEETQGNGDAGRSRDWCYDEASTCMMCVSTNVGPASFSPALLPETQLSHSIDLPFALRNLLPPTPIPFYIFDMFTDSDYASFCSVRIRKSVLSLDLPVMMI